MPWKARRLRSTSPPPTGGSSSRHRCPSSRDTYPNRTRRSPMTITAPENAKPVTIGSTDLDALLAYIDAGVVDRDDADRHPFEEFEAIRSARLGALRLPVTENGGGATLTELF